VLQHCLNHFPTASLSEDLDEITHRVLTARGWSNQNTLFAHASCPDEVNYDDDSDLVNVVATRWGSRFTLGGLAGMSFSGQTGWGAFGNHTPKDGNIFILYGPHVGVGSNGEVGKVRRQGQDHDSTCCGAAVAAYKCAQCPGDDDWMHDMQQIALTKLLQPLRKVIEADPEPMKALVYANFELSHDYIRKQLTSPENVCREIVVLGGIMVNLPGNLEDRFVPITFEHLDCRTGKVENLFGHFGLERTEHVFGSTELRQPFFQDIAQQIVNNL